MFALKLENEWRKSKPSVYVMFLNKKRADINAGPELIV